MGVVAAAAAATVSQALSLSGSSTLVVVGLALGGVVAVVRRRKHDVAATASEASDAVREAWDYIIVGGGTAGCVLANRLSAADKKVLVIEAGRSDYDHMLVKIPAGVLRTFKSVYDWDFTSQNEKATSGRGIYLPRGKVLGGSSCLNVCLYQRGDANDYNLWETEFGCDGWAACDVLPHFKRSENDQTGLAKTDPKHHSTGGEWSVDNVRYQNPLSKTFLSACKEAGLPDNSDFNSWGHKQEGAGRFCVSQKGGSRCSAATAMLEPALAKGDRKLKVLSGAPCRKIVFGEGNVVKGVLFKAGGAEHVARIAPKGEVILAGGAIHSPQILMLSGIGPKKHLQDNNISVLVDSPGVGANLQDHPAAVVSFECPQSCTGVSVTSKLRIAGSSLPNPRPLLQWLFTGSGPLTSTGCDHGGYFRTSAAGKDNNSTDLQMRFLAARAVTADGMGSFTSFKNSSNHKDGFTFQAIAARPRSRGTVSLKSSNPDDKPIIQLNYLTDKQDVATIREGIRLGRKIAQQKSFKEYVGEEVFPGKSIQNDADLDAYISDTVHTANALVGTCRMGKADDPDAVCDPEMRVKGCTGLRVCDASLMPKITGGQTGACVVMMAERAADMVLGKKK